MGRLPVYLRALVDIAESGASTVSSEALAEAAGVNSAKVRKDLSHLGSYGTRGVGYDVAYLIHQIRRELGLTQDWPIVIAGIGNLGHALANYRGFPERGFSVAALVDVDPSKVGQRVGGSPIHHVDDLPELVRTLRHRDRRDRHARGGRAGGRGPDGRGRDPLDPQLRARDDRVPKGVSVRKVDLAVELQILAFYEQRKATLADVRRRGRAVADVER